MKGWKYHYERAEALLIKAEDPNATAYLKQVYVDAAQVHATLATCEVKEPVEPIKTANYFDRSDY